MLFVEGPCSLWFLVGASDYGDALAAQLHLTIYATERATLFTTVVHYAVLDAVKDLVAQLEGTQTETSVKEVLKAW